MKLGISRVLTYIKRCGPWQRKETGEERKRRGGDSKRKEVNFCQSNRGLEKRSELLDVKRLYWKELTLSPITVMFEATALPVVSCKCRQSVIRQGKLRPTGLEDSSFKYSLFEWMERKQKEKRK